MIYKFCQKLLWYGDRNDRRDDGFHREAAGMLEVKIKNSCLIG